MFTETLSQAVDRLTAAGYTDDFRAEPDGMRAVVAGVIYRPESLAIEEVVRFEGISDPADEAIVFALHCREDGIKGTYTVPFGPEMGALDAEMIRGLRNTTPRE
jgi:hypothetical protein